MTAERIWARPRSSGSSRPPDDVVDAQPLELQAPVPLVEQRDACPQCFVAEHVRQQLEEHAELLDGGVHAAHLLDEQLSAPLGIDALHAALGGDVLVVDHGIEDRGDEPGLVAEVVGDHRLVLARRRGHRVECEGVEAVAGDDGLGRYQQLLRRLRQAGEGILEGGAQGSPA